MTRREKILAVAPLFVPWLAILVSWRWGDIAGSILPVALLLAGTVVGLRKGVPLWSYSWLALAIVALFSMFLKLIMLLKESGVQVSLTALSSVGFLSPVAVMGVAFALSFRRGTRHALTFYALGLVRTVAAYSPLWNLLVRPGFISWGVTSYLRAFVGLGAVVTVAVATYRFLEKVPRSMALFWILVATTLIAGYLLTFLSLYGAAEGLEAYWAGLAIWAPVLVMLLLAWSVSSLGNALGRRRDRRGATA